MRFTTRDLLWFMMVVSLSVGLWISSQGSMTRENLYKLWAFDIAVKLLEEKTGDKMTVDHRGVSVVHPDGTAHGYGFGSD